MANLQVSQRNTSSYKTIQAAVNAALPGDTVEVGEGVYNGHLFVDKSLVLKSASGEAGSVRVTGSVRIVTTEEVRIESISIEGAADSADDGVHIESG